MEDKPATPSESPGLPCSSSDAVPLTPEAPRAIKDENLAATEEATCTTVTLKCGAQIKEAAQIKIEGERKNTSVHFDEKPPKLIESDCEVSELLGSVITHNCPGTRTSARVIQKMKQDQVRPVTPPPPPPAVERDHKKDDKPDKPKPQTQPTMRTQRPIWSNLERNMFFDAVNEYGKDFEAIENYINTRLRRRNIVDVALKTKDQVRQHYYTTFHKICKYVRFSDEIRKPAQELYALINYGEMRRKLQFVTDKHFMKLKNLVYHGHITVRCKGKNVRVKTPSCKALRKLNQLDDYLEDIRLPTKIEVTVRPTNMESFGRVQMIAQNPRVSCIVPLHKKLASFIKTFQHKWRSREHRLAEKEHKMFSARGPGDSGGDLPMGASTSSTTLPDKVTSSTAAYKDAEMCFIPKPGVAIHRPLVSITEYLSSGNICLTAYEERMGVEVRSETLSIEQRPSAGASKRPRTESGSEKASPESKKFKPHGSGGGAASPPHKAKDSLVIKTECLEPTALDVGLGCSSDELSDELNELLADTQLEPPSNDEPALPTSEVSTSSSCDVSSGPAPPLPSQATATLTPSRAPKRVSHTKKPPERPMPSFKPLLSEDMIRGIRRGWTVSNAADITIGDLYVVFGSNSRLDLHYYWTRPLPNATIDAEVFLQKQTAMPHNPSDCGDPNRLQAVASSTLGNRLKHLLLIANLSERVRKRQCSCGHICDRRFESFVSNKTFNADTGGDVESGVFRTPIAPVRRPVLQMDAVKQLAMLSRHKTSRHLLVQRLITPGGGANRWVFDTLDDDNPDDPKNKDKSTVSSPRYLSPWGPPNRDLDRRNMNLGKPKAPGDSSKTPATMTSASTQTQLTTIDLCNFANVLDAAAASSLKGATNVPAGSAGAATSGANAVRQPDSAFDESSNVSAAASIDLMRETTSNSRWLEENLNDFSLTSLLGHLDDINGSRDLLDQSSNLSVISESSVDYMHKFQEIAALLQSQEKD